MLASARPMADVSQFSHQLDLFAFAPPCNSWAMPVAMTGPQASLCIRAMMATLLPSLLAYTISVLIAPFG
jgi:hypothetical protein